MLNVRIQMLYVFLIVASGTIEMSGQNVQFYTDRGQWESAASAAGQELSPFLFTPMNVAMADEVRSPPKEEDATDGKADLGTQLLTFRSAMTGFNSDWQYQIQASGLNVYYVFSPGPGSVEPHSFSAPPNEASFDGWKVQTSDGNEMLAFGFTMENNQLAHPDKYFAIYDFAGNEIARLPSQGAGQTLPATGLSDFVGVISDTPFSTAFLHDSEESSDNFSLNDVAFGFCNKYKTSLPFFDDFDRPDGTVGHGWLDLPSPEGATLQIVDEECVHPFLVATAGIYRPVIFDRPIRVNATLKESAANTGANRFASYFLLDYNGTGNQGYGVLVSRTSSNFNNSRVLLMDNGIILDQQSSPFQFQNEIDCDVTISPDGSVVGSISENGSIFEFQFEPRNYNASGPNFAFVPSHGGGPNGKGPFPRMDDFSIDYAVDPNEPGIQDRKLVLRLDGQDPDGDGILGASGPTDVWTDKSGFQNDAVAIQGLSIATPFYDPSLFDNKGGFSFNGLQGFESPFDFSSILQAGADFHAFTVFESSNSLSGSVFFADRAGDTSTHFAGLCCNGRVNIQGYGGNDVISLSEFTDGLAHLVSSGFSSATPTGDATGLFFVDGVSQFKSLNSGGTNPTSTLTLGLDIVSDNTPQNQFIGSIGELIIFQGTLQPIQLFDVQAYLGEKWGIPITNPNGLGNVANGRILVDPNGQPPIHQVSAPTFEEVLPPKTPDADYLTVIVHGWKSSPSGNDRNFIFLKELIEDYTTNPGNFPAEKWDVWIYDWETDAAFDALLPFPSPENKRHARVHGARLADHITNQMNVGGGYKHIHFISHSLGGRVVETATDSLFEREVNDTPNGFATLHTTFLDAYTPDNWESEYGEHSEFAEHYFVNDLLADIFGGNTNDSFRNAHNVTLDILGNDLVHGFPVEWYLQTVLDPNDKFNCDYGFELSAEFTGVSNWGYPHDEFPRNRLFSIGTCEEFEGLTLSQIRRRRLILPAAFHGGVGVTIKAARMIFGQSGLGPDAPTSSWANLSIDTTTPVNFLQFDLEFETQAQGNLYVLVDDQVVAQYVEEFSQDGVNAVSVYMDEKGPGEHVLSFLLVPEDGINSQVAISNIDYGLTTSDSVPVDSITQIDATILAGSISEIRDSDDARLELASKPKIVNSNSGRPNRFSNRIVAIEVNGLVPDNIQSITKMQFLVEASSPANGVIQRVEFFDFVSGVFEEVSQNPVGFDDEYSTVAINSNPARFVNKRDNSINARLVWSRSVRNNVNPLAVNIDQMFWIVETE